MTLQGYVPLDIQRYLDVHSKRTAQCEICERLFTQENDEILCPACIEAEDQARADHQDEVAVALAATNGTL